MNDSPTITDNTASDGGGVYGYGTFNNVSAGANVYDDTPNDVVDTA